MYEGTLAIRPAAPKDERGLRRLAALDSGPTLTGDVLVAETDGVLVAAITMSDGTVAADPFRHTVVAVHLLRLRRFQLLRGWPPARKFLRRLQPEAGV